MSSLYRKTAAQIRRLRESIQAKAFKMNNPPAFYEKRKNNMRATATAAQKISEEERLDQENQVNLYQHKNIMWVLTVMIL